MVLRIPDAHYKTEATFFWWEIEGQHLKLGRLWQLEDVVKRKFLKFSISEKLSDLIEAIRDSSEKKTEEKESLSTNYELRRLFPSIRTKIAEDNRPSSGRP